MSSYKWVDWEQPILSSNTDYGVVSASSINTATAGNPAEPWKALDGIYQGSTTSWEAAIGIFPAWWMWKLPIPIKISKLVLYNKYSGSTNVTKDVSIYANDVLMQKIASGTFEGRAFSTLTFTFPVSIVTDTLIIVCENGYATSGVYIGIGEVEITAQQQIAVEDEFLLTTLKTIIESLNLPLETGVFKDKAPDRYVVFTPLSDSFDVFADNKPQCDIQEVRISLFDKGNYLKTKNALVQELLSSDLTITDRRYIGHENDTGYHHYVIDVANNYEI